MSLDEWPIGLSGQTLIVAALAGAPVDPGQQAAVAARVEHVGVLRIRRDVAALAAADRVELAAPVLGTHAVLLSCCAPQTW